MLRPHPARWFEILCARDDATLALEALARTGAVELETRPGAVTPTELADVMPLLARFQDLSARYRAYWPPSDTCRPSALPQPPLQTLRHGLATIDAWAAQAEPVIRALQRAAAERTELQRWHRVLQAMASRPLDPSQLAHAGPLVQVRLMVLPAGTEPEQALPAVEDNPPGLQTLTSALEIDGVPHALVAAAPAALQALAERVNALKGSLHEVPPWLQADPGVNEAYIEQRLAALESGRSAHDATLASLHAVHALPCVLGDLYRLQWVLHNVRTLEAGPLFCWITGWSSDADGTRLAQALQHSQARALLRFAKPPAGLRPPLLLTNPPWARPFEIFSRALGMPASAEADPTPLLAIVVPLMFGYMFGDVGQGLVIAAVAWCLRKRFAIARLLVVGGLAASLFGLVFGSLFALDGIVPAWWLHPLGDPLAVLLVPLFGGALLLTAGLALDALAAWWRGEMRRWLLTDAARVVVYLALLAAIATPAGWIVAVAGTLWFVVGHALHLRRVGAAFAAAGELVEKTLQILINTLSFARVGAFALAHAGLSSAIVALMDAADSTIVKALVLLIGNVLVIVLEAMVVAIQTTRLVLFEFFTRFMQGTGRAFRALPAPPFTVQEP